MATGDVPTTATDFSSIDAALVLRLEREGRAWIRSREPDPVRAERIVDLATFKLCGRLARRDPPSSPRGWFFRVLRNELAATDADRRPVALRCVDLPRLPAEPIRSADPGQLRDWLGRLRPLLEKCLAPGRYRAFEVTLEAESVRAACESLGVARANYRRALSALAERIRREIERGDVSPPPSTW